MIARIESKKLNRTLWMVDTREEARRVWHTLPYEKRGSIYLKSEVNILKGAEVDIEAVQLVKDCFPGSIIIDHGFYQPPMEDLPKLVQPTLFGGNNGM